MAIDLESRRISSFFDCPRLSFDLEIKPSPRENGRIDYATSGGLTTILCPNTEPGAYFHPDDERNIITISSLPSREHLTKMLRHEIVHGYHFRNNGSLQSARGQVQNYFPALESILRSSEEGNELSLQDKEIIVSFHRQLVKQTVAYEAIARGYVDSRNKERESQSVPVSFDSKAKVSEEAINRLLTNYDLDLSALNALNLTAKGVIPFLISEYKRAYFILRLFADQALFIDDSSDLPPNITSKKDERHPSGTEVSICPRYKPLSPSQVEHRLRAWFAMDYVALADSLIDKNARHCHRIRDAFNEYQRKMGDQ